MEVLGNSAFSPVPAHLGLRSVHVTLAMLLRTCYCDLLGVRGRTVDLAWNFHGASWNHILFGVDSPLTMPQAVIQHYLSFLAMPRALLFAVLKQQ